VSRASNWPPTISAADDRAARQARELIAKALADRLEVRPITTSRGTNRRSPIGGPPLRLRGPFRQDAASADAGAQSS
jgi:hypothetical protein